MIDRYFTVLEQLTERTEALEDKLLLQATPALLKEIHEIKREAMVMRKKEHLVDGVETAGAGTFLGYAAEAAITLFI